MTTHKIKELVEFHSDLDLSIKCRRTPYIIAKTVCILLCRRNPKISYQAIGDLLNINHASVMNLNKKGEYRVKVEEDYKKLYMNVLNSIDSTKPTYDQATKTFIKTIYKPFEDSLRECEKDVLRGLKTMSDTELSEFNNTRLKPYISMLKSRVVHKTNEVIGATRKHKMII